MVMAVYGAITDVLRIEVRHYTGKRVVTGYMVILGEPVAKDV
jgi:hypothetical protein